ncbi:phage portal protein [Methylobacterium brachiatum]|uniref:phage portal protein n=1 Tax=Methylobacterium brachiatum TaxID=269660 RepID=UPI00244D59A4|nr:phage portal protein [Methylobacterium brachiatum]MDH2310352.1 phage portal protein [Methylobacterium brachiatum]
MASPSRGGVAGIALTPLSYTLTYGSAGYGSTAGRASGWFGPSVPMRPSAPPEVAGRRFDYPTGYNLNTTARAYEPVSFAQLRRLADGYDLLRLVIETRKDQAARMKWAIKPRDAGKSAAAKVAAVTAFLARPDGIHPWTDWLRMGLEDVLVLDAWSNFKQRSRAGDLLALEPIDGATIKPILAEDGRVPLPWVQGGETVWPEAYQQILKGLPAVNYTARELLYRPRNLRTDRVYGFSPVEQVMTTVNIALRRQVMTLEYFTSGSVPDALIGVPETWGPDQIATYQTYWDSLFTDNLAARRRARFVPGKVALHQTSEPQLKGEFDEWLSRVVCFAFSISPQALIKQMNRASADTQKEIAEEEGLAPLLDWIKVVLDDVIADDLAAPELEFAWQEDEQIDEAKQSERLRGLTAGGLMRLNEGRKILGLDPDPSPAADTLMVLTGAGLVPIDANTLEGKKAALDAFGPPPGANGFGNSGQDAEDRGDDQTDAVTKLLAKFAESQPRDASGRWTDGSGGGGGRVASEAAERAEFKRTVLRTAIGGAVIAGGAIVTAASGGTVPAAVAAAVWIAENYLLTDALVSAGRHIGAHLGYDDAEIARMLDHLTGTLGFGKAAGNVAAGERVRTRLVSVADAVLDTIIDAVRDGDLDADRRTAIVEALEALRARLSARIAHLPAPTHKATGVDLAKRRTGRPADPVPFDRPATRRAMRRITDRLGTALAATRSDVVAGLRGLAKLTKAGPDYDDTESLLRVLDAYLDDLDFADLRAVAPEVADELESVAADAGRRALVQLGAADRDALVNQVNTRAVAAARARAAEMVGMRFDADGALVPSANADRTITEATRLRLRETIASGLERNIGLDAITDAIEADYAFSEDRAARIAEYEVASANGVASVEGYRDAAEAGVSVRKAWWAEEGCCAVCQANADAGAIELDEDFPSGDEASPAHPSCRCVVVPVVEAGPEDEAVGKAFDPSKHPRGGDGRFSGAGGADRRARRIAQRAIADRQHVDNVDLGRVPGSRFSAHAGREVDGWRFELDAVGARHTDNHHGPHSGDRNPIRAADFEKLRRVLQRGTVRAGEGRTRAENLPVVTVDHTVQGETYHAVLTVRKRYRTLRLHSFSKRGK